MTSRKILVFAGAAALALLAFTGTASATQLTSPAGTTYTGSFHASDEAATIHTVLGSFSCAGTLAGNVEQHGSGIAVKGSITTLTFTACSIGVTVKALKTGTMEIHSIAGTNNGTVTLSGSEIEVFFPQFGIRCLYSTSNTDIGTLTGSNITGATAAFDIAGTLAKSGGSVLCPNNGGTWTGKYKVSSPDNLLVDA